MYAGLASAMVALVFLYICASIFIYGGELNSVIRGMFGTREAGNAGPRHEPPARDTPST
jgi:membrane protein